MLASCDSDGVIKCWDLRTLKEKSQIDGGPYSANGISIDRSGKNIAVGGDDGVVRVYGEDGKLEASLKGHEDSV